MGLTYTTPTVRDICSFAVFFLVSQPFCRLTLVYEGRLMLCYKETLEPSDRAIANIAQNAYCSRDIYLQLERSVIILVNIHSAQKKLIHWLL